MDTVKERHKLLKYGEKSWFQQTFGRLVEASYLVRYSFIYHEFAIHLCPVEFIGVRDGLKFSAHSWKQKTS